MNKTCFKCQKVLPISEFYVHQRMADGHINKCKTCTKADVKRNRIEKPDQLRAYEERRAKTEKRRALSLAQGKKQRAKHPERDAARTKLLRAVRAGIVAPWPVCAIPTCHEKPEAHHPDYSRPLDVVWLCSSHHKRAHHAADVADHHSNSVSGN